MRFLAFVLAALLIFGCTGGGPQPSQPVSPTNTTNTTPPPPPVKIIIQNQTNQTQQQNVTQQPPPTEVNQTPPSKEIQYESNPDLPLGIYFMDVGTPYENGEAILVKKGDLSVLIDAGPADNGGKVVDFLRSKGVINIGLLISTTADPLRYGGINAVADNFQIQQFWWNGETFNDQDYSSIIDRMNNQTKTVKVVTHGESEDLDGMNFTFLNPQEALFTDVNNDAIAIKITDRNFSILLPSDIQSGAQGKMLQTPGSLAAEVLDAPYYGTGVGTSNIGLFLRTVNPKDVVITGSSDDSAPNGGSRMPFKRLMSEYGMNWNETYYNGTVRVQSDGTNYSIMDLGAGQ